MPHYRFADSSGAFGWEMTEAEALDEVKRHATRRNELVDVEEVDEYGEPIENGFRFTASPMPAADAMVGAVLAQVEDFDALDPKARAAVVASLAALVDDLRARA